MADFDIWRHEYSKFPKTAVAEGVLCLWMGGQHSRKEYLGECKHPAPRMLQPGGGCPNSGRPNQQGACFHAAYSEHLNAWSSRVRPLWWEVPVGGI